MKPGTTLGKYRLNSILGGGGFSEVYTATHLGAAGFSRDVAVKVLRPELQSRKEAGGLFAREARNIAQLHHRNIVQVFEFAVEQEISFLVMELVQGTTARELTLMGGALPIWAGVSIGLEVARGLKHAHELTDSEGRALGLVHRDIKPSNILISDQGDVKLSDFGLSKRTLVDADQLTRIGVVRGTLAYMSPEQKLGDSATTASDIYGLGRVVYELCAGIGEGHPLGVKRGQDLPPLRSIRDQIPAALNGILQQALSKIPGERPSAENLSLAFQQVLAELLQPEQLSRLSEERAHWVEVCRTKKPAPKKAPRTHRLEEETAEKKTNEAPLGESGQGAHTEDTDVVVSRWAEHSTASVAMPPEEISSPALSQAAAAPAAPLQLVRLLLMTLMVIVGVAVGIYFAQLPESTSSSRRAQTAQEDAPQINQRDAGDPLPIVETEPTATDPDLAITPDAGKLDAGKLEVRPSLPPPRKSSRQRPRGSSLNAPALPQGDIVKLRKRSTVKPRQKIKPRARVTQKPAGQGLLSINSNPWSKVFLDGHPLGTTPIYRHELSAGSHRLELRRQNGSTWRRRVTVRPGKHKNLGLIQLK